MKFQTSLDFNKIRQQVVECWVVILFVVKVEVDRLTVEVEGQGGSIR
jgi:hypothetical protein